MGNVVLSLPDGGANRGIRPYLSAGVGMFLGQRFGLRADVRYFRGLEPLDDEDPITDNPFFDQELATKDFNFWRGTLGITFRFGR